MNRNHSKYLFYSLNVIGIIISVYLFFRHIALMDMSAGGGIDFCSEFFKLGCDDALKSPMANFLEIPLAGWGIIYYISITTIFSLGDFLENTFNGVAENLLVFITGITSLISSIFIIAFIFSLIPFCPLCLLIHIINLALLFTAIKLSSKSFKESLISFYSGIEEFFITKGPIPGQTRQKIIPLLLIAALALLFYQWIFMQVMKIEVIEEISFDELHFFEEYQKEEFLKISISPDDPIAGPADALVNFVLFSDFECSGCRQFSGIVDSLLSKYKTELKVVFKHYPLSSKCNSTSVRDLHPNACQAAAAAVAANRQGKFWEYHDLLFSSKIYGEEEQYLDYAEKLGLDVTAFTNDMNSTAREKVVEDINLGHEIGVDGTPTIYVNGRKVKDLSFKALDWLVETMHGIIKNQTSL